MKSSSQQNTKTSFLYGFWPVMEAIREGKSIEKVYIKQGMQGEKVGKIRQALKGTTVPMQYVPAKKFKKIAKGNHQGIAAMTAQVKYFEVEDILMQSFDTGEAPLFLLLDRISDVRNLGAIARTAEATQVDALILPMKGSAMINEDAMKTSAGALHHLPLCRIKNVNETLQFLKNSGLQILAALEKGATEVGDVDFRSPTVVVLGAEGKGIPPEHLKHVDKEIAIPLHGQINSLNVSVAAGMILYEIGRQRF